MLYIVYSMNAARDVYSVTSDYDTVQAHVRAGFGYVTRNDFKTEQDALTWASKINAAGGFDRHMHVDNGPHHLPRYDVIRAPAVGDKVSHAFNGDSYPSGEIVKISTSHRRVETSTGEVFFRRKLSAAWLRQGWSMIQGHHNDRNPHF